MGAGNSQNYPNYPNAPGGGTQSQNLQQQNINMKSQTENNKLIEKKLKIDKEQMYSTQKLLLLGPGESGKSTVLKQMRILHAEGFTEKEMEIQKIFIRANLVQSIFHLIKAMEQLNIPFKDEQLQVRSRSLLRDTIFENCPAVETVLECVKEINIDKVNLNGETGEAIKHIWSDPGIQRAYERRSEFQLIDSAKYFLDAVDRISAENYLPNQDDILRCRVQTTGVVEVRFTIRDLLFRVVDVGGQRSERRKWIQCFDDVNSILFIASLSEYDQTLEEDNTTNRTRESLLLFSFVCSHKLFLKTPIILFLNKTDLFEEKVQRVPITVAFPEYDGPQTLQDSLEYINSQYVAMNTDLGRNVYTHQTCATDTKQISFILQATIDIIIKERMRRTNLV